MYMLKIFEFKLCAFRFFPKYPSAMLSLCT